MKDLINVLKKHDLRTNSYETRGNCVIIRSNKGKYVLKKKRNSDIFNYLDSRSFNYYPKYINDDDYLIMEYLDEQKMPIEQKMLDLINLVSLLHNKTTYYSNVDIDEYKKNYEELKGNIEYLRNYYDGLITNIESKIYMSPSELLLARGISIIFSALNYSDYKLDHWYKSVKDKNRRRYVVIHNNLSLDHFIRGKNLYLISWDNAKVDLPIYDLYKLYKKYAFDFDFKYLIQKYQKNYPLLEEELNLFYILISIPDKIEFTDNTYNDCVKIENLIDYLYKTESIISPENLKDTKQNQN
ncbi:MAG: hypothetical protein J6G98_05640 [Bacilli bacterium]|nr:hypothetical protein [Bacilli bacterium]